MSGPTILLDRTRPYGECHGEGLGLQLYEQDGLPFDHNGELLRDRIPPELAPLVQKKLEKLAKKQAKAANPETAQTEIDPEPDPDDPEPGEVNFDAWARGIERYQWTALAAEARKRFHKSFRGKDDLIEFLVFEAKMIAVEDVAPALRPKE